MGSSPNQSIMQLQGQRRTGSTPYRACSTPSPARSSAPPPSPSSPGSGLATSASARWLLLRRLGHFLELSSSLSDRLKLLIRMTSLMSDEEFEKEFVKDEIENIADAGLE